MKKTLLVGLDAACWDYLNPLLQDNQLPTLRKLMDTGIWGTLNSTMPAHTPTAWASIITGKNPGKHGVYDHLWRHPHTYEFAPTNARLRLGTPFWQRLNEQGYRVGLVNVPFTHPPDPVDGFVVGGFGTPRSAPDITYPTDELAWIREHLGPYEPIVDPKLFKTATPKELFYAEREHQANQVQIASELAEQYQVHALVINLMLLDHANHRMPDTQLVEQAIRESDIDLNNLIQAFRPDNVMLFSDHGSRRVKGTFLLHAWLRDQGYCVQTKRTPSEYADAINWLLLQWSQTKAGSWARYRLFRYLARNIIPKFSDGTANWFWEQIEKNIPFSREYAAFSEHINYERTHIYFGASYSGLLYFNLAGRDPTGIVQSQDQPVLTIELIEKLGQIPDPATDQPLISHIYTTEDLYRGPTITYGPSLILDTYDASCNVLTNYRRGAEVAQCRGRYFVNDIKEFGRHSCEGVFVFSGDDFRTGHATVTGHVMDLPATLLHLYNVPLPEDYDGQSLTEFMTPELVNQQPVLSQPGDSDTSVVADDLYSAEETEDLINHLQALGYLE